LAPEVLPVPVQQPEQVPQPVPVEPPAQVQTRSGRIVRPRDRLDL
jgi:hypothetical protein